LAAIARRGLDRECCMNVDDLVAVDIQTYAEISVAMDEAK
jgi:hypothetical protein